VPYDDDMRQELAGINAATVQELIYIPTTLDDVDGMAGSTDQMYEASNALTMSYVSQSKVAYPSIPANRVELNTRLSMLANKMGKEACIIRLTNGRRLQDTMVAGPQTMQATINTFRQTMDMLANGAPQLGVPAVLSPERDDIKFQQARIAAAFAKFWPDMECVASPSCRATLNTRDSIDSLEAEVWAANPLYLIEDPIVEEVYSWTVLIYVIIGVLVCGVMGFGCYRGLRSERMGGKNRGSSADAGSV